MSFQILHIRDVIQYFSFSTWLTSLSMTLSRCIHIAAKWHYFTHFNGWVTFHHIYVPHLLYSFIFWLTPIHSDLCQGLWELREKWKNDLGVLRHMSFWNCWPIHLAWILLDFEPWLRFSGFPGRSKFPMKWIISCHGGFSWPQLLISSLRLHYAEGWWRLTSL